MKTREERIKEFETMLRNAPEIMSPLKVAKFSPFGKNRVYEMIRTKELKAYKYWGILTAIYLAVSFLNNQWHLSWIIFAVGGILFPVVMCICNYIADKGNKG